MTKKEQILETALKLFADRGYENTPSSLIAKEAGVSEGLIFKYYTNKENLLETIIKTGYTRIVMNNRGMLEEKDPQTFLNKILSLPSKLVSEERDFWRLQRRLWYDETAMQHHRRFMHPLVGRLKEAFAELGYKEPELETEVALMLVDSLWHLFIDGTKYEHTMKLLNVIKAKYQSPIQ
ncbi:TetR/AcrR family transcriptional regulator [Pontibacter harenae]|uniref:TetR/AcrR family transcriptional regulator n=1 Tax=Pontibacter harenae TaxID=2894083 RepID=UPI001E441A74|nr:TetR/AcrR family transcriptional regulator [Pontibacter harenae]MCC9167138.1 TetR/AcrR family transcriptional regulator [Pontibacter harenae]